MRSFVPRHLLLTLATFYREGVLTSYRHRLEEPLPVDCQMRCRRSVWSRSCVLCCSFRLVVRLNAYPPTASTAGIMSSCNQSQVFWRAVSGRLFLLQILSQGHRKMVPRITRITSTISPTTKMLTTVISNFFYLLPEEQRNVDNTYHLSTSYSHLLYQTKEMRFHQFILLSTSYQVFPALQVRVFCSTQPIGKEKSNVCIRKKCRVSCSNVVR